MRGNKVCGGFRIAVTEAAGTSQISKSKAMVWWSAVNSNAWSCFQNDLKMILLPGQFI
jgi:hypothetical protein